jgi:transcriptional regulator with XRE-family HTH domain
VLSTAFGRAPSASQTTLAPLCELDRSYYGGVERGGRNPSLTNILRIANALQTTPADPLRKPDKQASDVQP